VARGLVEEPEGDPQLIVHALDRTGALDPKRLLRILRRDGGGRRRGGYIDPDLVRGRWLDRPRRGWRRLSRLGLLAKCLEDLLGECSEGLQHARPLAGHGLEVSRGSQIESLVEPIEIVLVCEVPAVVLDHQSNVVQAAAVAREVALELLDGGQCGLVSLGTQIRNEHHAVRAIENYAAVGASKAALEVYTRHLALEQGGSGVRVNAVAPGWMRTRMTETIWSDPSALAEAERGVALGYLAQPEEVAQVALFLSSGAASYITGQVLTVNGGRSFP